MSDWEKRRSERLIEFRKNLRAAFDCPDVSMSEFFDTAILHACDFGRSDTLKHLDEVPEVRAMREALEGFVRQFESGILPRLACEKAKEAIAKAKGES